MWYILIGLMTLLVLCIRWKKEFLLKKALISCAKVKTKWKWNYQQLVQELQACLPFSSLLLNMSHCHGSLHLYSMVLPFLLPTQNNADNAVMQYAWTYLWLNSSCVLLQIWWSCAKGLQLRWLRFYPCNQRSRVQFHLPQDRLDKDINSGSNSNQLAINKRIRTEE